MERERNHSIHRELFKHVAVALFRSTFSTLFALSTLEPRKQSIRHEFYFLGIPISFQRKVNPWKRVPCNVFTARRIEKCDIYIYIYILEDRRHSLDGKRGARYRGVSCLESGSRSQFDIAEGVVEGVVLMHLSR